MMSNLAEIFVSLLRGWVPGKGGAGYLDTEMETWRLGTRRLRLARSRNSDFPRQVDGTGKLEIRGSAACCAPTWYIYGPIGAHSAPYAFVISRPILLASAA